MTSAAASAAQSLSAWQASLLLHPECCMVAGQEACQPAESKPGAALQEVILMIDRAATSGRASQQTVAASSEATADHVRLCDRKKWLVAAANAALRPKAN